MGRVNIRGLRRLQKDKQAAQLVSPTTTLSLTHGDVTVRSCKGLDCLRACLHALSHFTLI